MKTTILLWKNIISNPFEGYRGVNDSTKVLFPLLIVIVLFAVSISLIIPLMVSESYGDALVRIQVNTMMEKGTEMSLEQQEAVAGNIKSPMVRNITVVSAYVAGLLFIFIIMVIISFILKVVASAVKREPVKFLLIFKILLFASLISMVQMSLKSGIALTGNWQRALARVNDSAALQIALMAPVSLAALVDPLTVGPFIYTLIDSVTDVFNWIYYVFFYAGLRASVELQKKPALIITIVTALVMVLGACIPLLLA